MKTGNIGITQNPYDKYTPPTSKPGNKHDKPISDIFKAPVDTYIPSSKVQAVDPATIDRLWNETNHMGEAVKRLVQSALGIKDGSGQGFWALRSGNFKLSEADRAEAQALIGEDGYFGVKQTTDRIMAFAKALVGEGASEEQIELMRDATQKGFDEVAKMFGGFDKLPDVTKETYKAVMEAFDNWKAGASASAGTATE